MKFRSRFGKNLTIVFGVVLVLAVGVNLGSNLSSLLVSIVTAAWIWNLAYLLLWRPSVEITERDLILNNLPIDMEMASIPFTSLQISLHLLV